jgi:hypothetical protein
MQIVNFIKGEKNQKINRFIVGNYLICNGRMRAFLHDRAYYDHESRNGTGDRRGSEATGNYGRMHDDGGPAGKDDKTHDNDQKNNGDYQGRQDDGR